MNKPLLFSLLICLSTFLSAEKPNIIFILADDLGWQDVGFNGSQYFETPNLDKLADRSLNFKNAYMYPTCSPSRTAIFTGKQSFRTQVYTVPVLEKGNAKDNIFSRWTVELKHKFYSQPLNEAGYKLIHLGKYHVVGPKPDAEKNYPFKKKLKSYGNGDISWVKKHKTDYKAYYPEGKGFHENVGGTWWGDPARGWKKGYKDPKGGYHAPFKNPFIEDKASDKWLTDRLTDDAIDFMKRHKNDPFFINLHFYTPHRPSIARSSELLQKYQNKSKDPSTGQSAKYSKETAAYATMVQNMDENVGRIIEFLKAEKLDKNTIIVFTSDNGYNSFQSMSNNLRGNKGQIYEGGIRVPFLLYHPKLNASATVKSSVTGIDLFPTFLDFAGIRDSYTETLDGDSLLPFIKKLDTYKNRPIFWQVSSNYKTPACTAMIKGNYKLIQWLKTGKTELYNLEKDMAEKKDLSKSQVEVLQTMLKEMISWRKKNNVPLPPSSKL